jgi:hypothetical protein
MKNKKDHYATLKEIPTMRSYIIWFTDSAQAPPTHTLVEIINYSLSDDHEWAHALLDRLDEVMDLQIAQTMHFFPNRDEKDIRREHALIKRIQ